MIPEFVVHIEKQVSCMMRCQCLCRPFWTSSLRNKIHHETAFSLCSKAYRCCKAKQRVIAFLKQYINLRCSSGIIIGRTARREIITPVVKKYGMDETHHKMHRTRPHAQLAVPLNVVVDYGLVLDFSYFFQPTSVPGSTTQILQAKDYPNDLCDCYYRHCGARAGMESGSLKIV
jgi:hypothetical protein